MTRFILKVAVFLMPIALVFVFPAAVYILSREQYSVQTVTRMQKAQPNILYNKAFIDSDSSALFYKQKLIQEKNPEVIILGASPSFQFRKQFFLKPDSFVNATFGAADARSMEDFIRNLPPDKSPRVIILGLYPLMFRPDYETKAIPTVTDPQRVANFFLYDWRKIYYDYFRGRFTLIRLLERARSSSDVGLGALMDDEGFRDDGSRALKYGGDRIKVLNDEISALIVSLKNDRNSYQYGPSISKNALGALDRMLELAKERHITVVGYIRPIPPPIYKELLSVHDEYRQSVFTLPMETRAILSKYGYDLYDFSDATVLGKADEEYIDVNHPTDKLSLRMIIHMAKYNHILGRYVDIPKAEALLRGTVGDTLSLPDSS